MPFASMDDIRKKEEEDKKATQSYAGGDKSGLAIQNPGDEDAFKKMQQLASAGAGSAGPLPANHVVVTVYRDGFTVGDGPFRPLSDPLNKKFMDDMAAGRSPEELQGSSQEPVHVAVHDKRGEDYKGAPAPARVNFSGEGNTLGGSSSSAAAPTVEAGQGSVQVDESKPKTKIQIRFHDGQKKAQEFNQEQTVGDLRRFCEQCVGGQAMAIKGGFPPKPITDNSMTLKDAGLCGAAVTVMPA
jgi:UBX domain-containing protein 1